MLVRPESCPLCHSQMRLGVRLTPLKTAIFDAVRRTGPQGISARELLYDIYGADTAISIVTIRMHILQINDLLLATDYRIVSETAGRRRRWGQRRPDRYYRLALHTPAAGKG